MLIIRKKNTQCEVNYERFKETLLSKQLSTAAQGHISWPLLISEPKPKYLFEIIKIEFFHSSLWIFRHSTIPLFNHSIVTLLNSTHCSLRRYSRSFEHFSPIEMVKWSLFESMKFVFKVSSICRSNLFRHFCKGEVFFSITCMRRHYEIILRCLSSIVVSRLELKNCIFGSTGNNSLIQTPKCSLFQGKVFPLYFHDALITTFKTFLQGKAFFSHAPFWNDCEMFVVFCRKAITLS